MYHRMFEMGDEKYAMLLQGLSMCSIPHMLAAYPYPCECVCVCVILWQMFAPGPKRKITTTNKIQMAPSFAC